MIVTGPAARTPLNDHAEHAVSGRAITKSASHNQVAGHDAAALGIGGMALASWWRSAGERTLSAQCDQRTLTGRRPGQDSNLRPMA